MGFLYPYEVKTKEDLVEAITTGKYLDLNTTKIVASHLKGDVVYMLVTTIREDETENVNLFMVWVLDQVKNDPQGPPSWGYKLLDETANPFYYDCPKSWLNRADKIIPNHYPTALEWRRTVLINHALKSEVRSLRLVLKLQGMTKEEIDTAIKLSSNQILDEVRKKVLESENKTIMGISAYNRGSKVIKEALEKDPAISTCFQLMDRWNAIPKNSDAESPFTEVHILFDQVKKVWAIECPVTGFAYFYPGEQGIEKLMKMWNIFITKYDETTDTWTAEPAKKLGSSGS